jgi:hypothetical protein
VSALKEWEGSRPRDPLFAGRRVSLDPAMKMRPGFGKFSQRARTRALPSQGYWLFAKRVPTESGKPRTNSLALIRLFPSS